MGRSSIVSMVPDYCRENELKGCCRICGKSKPFNKHMKKFCKDECAWKYQEFFLTWDKLRRNCFHRDNYTCKKCGFTEGEYIYKNLEADHIVAIVNGGMMWDEENIQTLCKPCHKEKTKKDLSYRSKGNRRLDNYA